MSDLVKRLPEPDSQGRMPTMLRREAAARIEQLEAQLAAAENLYRATEFLADNDPDEVVCDGGGTAILVGLSGIRKALTAYREARK